MAKSHLSRIASLQRALDTEDVVTIEVHDDPALWARMLAMALRSGFALVPGAFIVSVPHEGKNGRRYFSHAASLVRMMAPPEPAGAGQAIASTGSTPAASQVKPAEGSMAYA